MNVCCSMTLYLKYLYLFFYLVVPTMLCDRLIRFDALPTFLSLASIALG